MSTPQEIARIPAPEVDHLEWLSTEALWSSAKSPFSVQWDRWLTYTNPRDQMSIPGLVIQGNLQRYHASMRNAEAFADGEGRPDGEFLSQAAEHLGKTAGGLVGISTHFSLPEKAYNAPLEDLIPAHIAMADLAIRTSILQKETTKVDDYYAMLEPLGETVVSIENSSPKTRRQLSYQAVANANRPASAATHTWLTLLDRHPEIMIVPGATPRSSGEYIEDLRANFQQYIPLIRETVAAYRT